MVTFDGRVLAFNQASKRMLGELNKGEALSGRITSATTDFSDFLRQCARSRQTAIGGAEMIVREKVVAVAMRGGLLVPGQAEQPGLILLRLGARENANQQFVELQNKIQLLKREVARRHRMEYELRSKTEWLQVTLASMGDALITTDANSLVTYLNPVAEELTGWPLEEAKGRPLSDIFIVQDERTLETVANPVQEALALGKVVALANHSVLICRHGSQLPIEDTAAPIYIDGELAGAVLIFHDVSERRVLQKQLMERAEKLEEANKRKSDFLVMLAHELRNPVTPISNAVQLMQMEVMEKREFPETIDIIARQIRHLTRLVDDLLDVSRINRGKIHIQPEVLSLSDHVSAVCSAFRSQFDRGGVSLEFVPPGYPLWVKADPTRITQLLDNLLVNALKFTPQNGSVRVEVCQDQADALITVRDNGIGIEPELLPTLFEPFTQAAQSLDRSSGGLGLGLSLVQGIVELHRGRVMAESDGSNQGSTFKVWLPLSEEAPQPSIEPPSSVDNRQQTILLIEDEPDTANTMAKLLSLLGHQVTIAHSGPEGLDKAVESQPSIVFCDIGLPGMDGFTVAEKLRAHRRTQSSYLIALTGYGERSFTERALQAGFNRHMVKPVSLEAVSEAIAEAARQCPGLS